MNYEQGVTDDEQRVAIEQYRGPLNAASPGVRISSKQPISPVETSTPPANLLPPVVTSQGIDLIMIAAILSFGSCVLALPLWITFQGGTSIISPILSVFGLMLGMVSVSNHHHSKRPRLARTLGQFSIGLAIVEYTVWICGGTWLFNMFIHNGSSYNGMW